MSHRVTLMPSGRTFEVPEGKAILTAGLDAGCNLPYSCRSGCCLTCHGTLLEGEVDYGFVLDIYLTPERKAAGTVLLCQAKPLSDVVVEVQELSLKGITPRVFPAKVRRIEKRASDVAVVTLRMPPFDNMLFAAGQYIDLLLSDAQGTLVRRSYSVANAPEVGLIDLELHVRHTPGGLFTDRVFKTLAVDERLQFEGPLGTFYLREEIDKPIVFVASGTGFGPIKSIIEYALKRKISRPMALYWGCRTRADLYMLEKPQAWAAANPGFSFIPVLSDEQWEGRTGLVHRAVMADFPDLSGHQVYACGAPVMVEAARGDFAAKCGLPADEFFADAFLTEADKHRSPT